MTDLNLAADAVIYLASLWILLTRSIRVRTAGSIGLALVGLSALANLVTTPPCIVNFDVVLKASLALMLGAAFVRIEGPKIWKRIHDV